MPISYKNKLIFVHNPKTAGTSIMNHFEMERRTHANGNSVRTIHRNVWDSYKKFMVVRNPWDRFFSSYSYSIKKESYYHSIDEFNKKPIHPDYKIIKNMTFYEFVEFFGANRNILKHQQWRTQFSWYVDGVSIIKYENLNKELTDFIGTKVVLPYQNKSTSVNYKDFYNSYLIEKVYDYYKEDIDFFNYEF